MLTIRNAVGRLFRSYLEPPHLQPAVARLTGDMLTADIGDQTTFNIAGWAVSDDEEMMRIGVLLEIDAEIIEVLTYDEFTGDCLGERGALETTPAAHAAGARTKLGPSFARQSVIEAIGDNILTLYPSLYQVRVVNTGVVGGNIAAMEDPLAVEVVGVYQNPNDPYSSATGTVVDHHPAVAGRAVVLDGYPLGSAWIRYRRRMGSVASEDDLLEDLGVDPRWLNIVLVGAAADLMVGQDIPESQVEWIGQALKAEAIRVGQRAGLAGALSSYRQILLERAKAEMQAEYKAVIHHKPLTVSRRASF